MSTTWPAAARAFAGRLTRRARAGAVLLPLALGLAGGAALALGAAWLGPSAVWRLPWPWLAAGALAGLGTGLARARRVDPVAPADAAWALDRLARARERGLTAATVEGPRGAEAAFAAPPLPPPPAVRLLPAPGLAPLAGALLLVLVAALAGRKRAAEAAAAQPSAPPAAETATRRERGAAAAAGAAAQAEEAARAAEREARAADRVLRALGLSTEERADPSELTALFTDPERRRAARQAAAGAGGLGAAFDAPGASAEEMARQVVDAAEGRLRARELRRKAVVLRTRAPVGTVPLHRRAVVERYYERSGEHE